MAREVTTRVVSDISGREISEQEAVLIILQFPDGRRNRIELDAAESEVSEWASKGREIKRRGRRPGTRMAKPDPK